jgi:hypothetical protein
VRAGEPIRIPPGFTALLSPVNENDPHYYQSRNASQLAKRLEKNALTHSAQILTKSFIELMDIEQMALRTCTTTTCKTNEDLPASRLLTYQEQSSC